MRIADLQSDITSAMLTAGDLAGASMIGGVAPARRFAIHSRHYAASVTRAIVERFTATVWLVGSAPIVRAAAAFVREHPPMRPCMAEYGDAFPAFLGSRRDDGLPAYVGQFAAIDWHLGRVAIAADAPAITSLTHYAPARIADARLTLQDGVAYMHVNWPLDELMSFYLSGRAPDAYTLAAESVFLEIRGSRGDLRMQRLAHGEFVFRSALSRGSTLGEAASAAADLDATFNPMDAVPRLLGEALVTDMRVDHAEC
ncbi:MAG TPA: DNA-binding domain-containing protein [Vicinamibacterales bacterium]